MRDPNPPARRRDRRRPRAALRLAAALTAALAASGPAGAAPPADPRCGVADPRAPGGQRVRMGKLRVSLEDASGRSLRGIVEVDGVRLGPTDRSLPAPVCGHVRVLTEGGQAWVGELEPSPDGFTSLRARLEPPAAARVAPAKPPPAVAKASPAAAPKDGGKGARAQRSPRDDGLPSEGTPDPSEARLPSGIAAIHYYRPDGQYEGWGLHTWDTVDGVDRPIGKITWDDPLKPSGRDEFGVYWFVHTHDYSASIVHFIVHRGSEKETCGQDVHFPLNSARERWVVAGQCESFFTRGQAIRAARGKW